MLELIIIIAVVAGFFYLNRVIRSKPPTDSGDTRPGTGGPRSDDSLDPRAPRRPADE